MLMAKTNRIWGVLACIAIVAGICIMALEVYAARAQRAANAAAERYAVEIQPRVSADRRYSRITVQPFSGFGCVRVDGSLATDQDLAALRDLLKHSVPKNVQISWHVLVDAAAGSQSSGL
jgi:hypothetical protein